MCCGGNSLFNKTDSSRKIKFSCDATGASLTVLDGAKSVSKISLCDYSELYTQYNTTQLYLPAGTSNSIPYNISSQVKFLFIKIQYLPKKSISSFTPFLNNSETPYIEYVFDTNLSEVRQINTMMLLSGTTNKKIPSMVLKNPNVSFDANITILVATDTITFESPLPTSGTIEPNKYITIPSNVSTFDATFNSSTSGLSNSSGFIDSTSGFGILDKFGYILFNDGVIIEIENLNNFFRFDTNGIGNNSTLEWNLVTDVGITKQFIFNNIQYNIQLKYTSPIIIQITTI
jgi:hypothetical protein